MFFETMSLISKFRQTLSFLDTTLVIRNQAAKFCKFCEDFSHDLFFSLIALTMLHFYNPMAEMKWNGTV